jgi:beta-1,4-mannosyltransferase
MTTLPICSVPASSGWNPYLPSINANLARLGVEIRRGARDLLGLKSAIRGRAIFHFHWPSTYYANGGSDGAISGLAEWLEFLSLAHKARCPIVWTAHNVWPHDHVPTELHTVARKALVAAAGHVIAHCNCAAEEISTNFGTPRKLSIIPHPCYEVDPRPENPATPRVRGSSGLSFLCVGALRGYKNLEFLANAFSAFATDHDCLVIAGPPHSSHDASPLRAICLRDRRIRLEERQLSEPELHRMLADTDVVVVGYSRITSAGAVILAHSHGKPVVAPRLGCLTEWVTNDTGEVYEPNSPESFGEAIARIRLRDLATLGANAKAVAMRETPCTFAQKLHAIYANLSEEA